MPELIIDAPLELCPRRQEIGDTSRFKVPQEDEWREDRSCSWCGSMSPELLFEAIEAGCKLTPTDKNYKLYIDGIANVFYVPNNNHSKFYFQHFSKEQCIKFIELSNDNKLKLGYPGYFYVIPFFMSLKVDTLKQTNSTVMTDTENTYEED